MEHYVGANAILEIYVAGVGNLRAYRTHFFLLRLASLISTEPLHEPR